MALAGVMPVSAAKARAKWRGLIAARSASRSTGSRSSSRSRAQVEQRREPAAGPIRLEQRRELRLPAGPAVIDHELLRGTLGDRLAEILGDQRQREIDAGGDAGRGPDRAVADENAVGLDADAGDRRGRTRRRGPMRGRAPAVEQPGRSKDEGARADARDPPRSARGGADIGQCLGAAGRLARAPAAGDDQRIERIVESTRSATICTPDELATGPASRAITPQAVARGRLRCSRPAASNAVIGPAASSNWKSGKISRAIVMRHGGK